MAKQFWKPGNLLYPLPVVMVSCQREGGRPNIITAAWAGTVNTSPPMVSVSVRPSRYSHDIIRDTGEFVINLTTRELAYAADCCGVRSGRDVDKYEFLKLTPCKSQMVHVPGIEESPVNIECRVVQVRKLGSHDMFLAEVAGVKVEDSYLDEAGKLHLDNADLVVYSHGAYFCLGERLGKFGYSVKKIKPKEKLKKTRKIKRNLKFSENTNIKL